MTSGLIDLHHHILPPVFLSTLGDRLGRQTLHGPAPEWSPQISLDQMDRNGIDLAVTSLGPPGFWFGDIAETVKLVRNINEYAAQLRRDHPARFGMFAVLPLPDVDACLREIEYAVETLKADGFEMMTNCAGQYPGDPAFAPVFDELHRRKAMVFFHPIPGRYGSPVMPEFPPATLEFPFDTTRAIMSLLYGGTLSRCRDVRFLFSHGGGALPFLADRVARLTMRDDFRRAVPDGPMAELKRLYFDTALSAHKSVFSSLLTLVDTGHVLFGTDFPQAPEITTRQSIRGLGELGLSDMELRGVLRDNALRLLPQLDKTARLQS